MEAAGMPPMPFDLTSEIAGELEEKNRLLDDYANEQPIDKVLQARIQQLAISKVLVFIHGKHRSLLVKAHCDLGESYLLNKFYDQAIDHFNTAKEINSSLFSSYEESRQFHPFVLMMLGKCHLEKSEYTKSIDFFEKALQMNEQLVGASHVSNVNIISDLAYVLTKKNHQQRALELYEKAVKIVEASFGVNSDTMASLYLDIAKTEESQGKYREAAKHQTDALSK